MIPFKDQNEFISEVVRGLTSSENPCSYNIVAPPGFLEPSDFAELICNCAQEQAPDFPIASISTTSVIDMDGYAERLASQWQRFGFPQSARNMDSLLACLSREKPAIQIVCYFEKIVDQFDDAILGKLRDAERNHALRSLTISYYSYNKLRDRWRERNTVFCCSNYGDTHECRVLEPAEFDAIAEALDGQGVPRGILEKLYNVTGGFPHALKVAVQKWQRLGTKTFDPATKLQITESVDALFDRCCQWLDNSSSNHWKTVLASCVMGNEREVWLAKAQSHQWFRVLFDEGSIRSEALIAALMKAWSARVLEERSEGESAVKALYTNKQYRTLAVALSAKGEHLPPHLILVRFHTSIMACVISSGDHESEEVAYKEAKRMLGQAKKHLDTPGAFVSPADREALLYRYEELLAFIDEVLNAIARDANCRIVDVLAKSGRSEAAGAALALLDERIEFASATLNHSAAIQLAVPLPEQIFRIWALWALNVDYYKAPEIDERAFADAANALKKLRNYSLDRFEQGRQFRDSLSFAFYCLALGLIGNLPPEHLPAKDLEELNSMFTRTADTRNPSGHCVVINKPTMRGNYFDCIAMWRDCLQRIAVSRSSQRNEGLLQPLPFVEPTGSVLW
jgi:hypothetical protein